MSSLSALGAGFVHSLAAPAVAQAASEIRYQLGWADLARDRNLFYRQQYRSANPSLDPSSDNFAPWRFNLDQVIRYYNQQPWARADNDPELRNRFLTSLRIGLRENGVNINTVEGGTPVQQAAVAWTNENALKWTRAIDMSSTAAPMGDVLRAYYRSLALPADQKVVDESELRFNLQRAQLRRKSDRDLVTQPFVAWSVSDILRLFAAGEIDEATRDALLKAAGLTRQQDTRLARALSGVLDVQTILTLNRRGQVDEAHARHLLGLAGMVTADVQDQALNLQWLAPSGPSIVTSAVRGAFSAELAATYGLDAGLADNPMVAYWMKAYGLTGPDGSPAPGAHDGPTDWMKYYWRGARPVIGFETALELQYRLRPDEADPTQSVVPGAPPWLSGNTLDSLKMMGYSDTQAQWLMGLARQPINIRLINHILGPFAHHADVRAAADAAFGVGVDWVKGAMLDHGFSDAYATVAAAGIHAQAEDRNNEEKLSQQRAFRKQKLDFYLRQYETGYVTRATVKLRVLNDQYDAAMADAALDLIDKAVQYGVSDAQLAAAKEGFMGGKLTLEQVGAQLSAIGVSDDRKVTYIQEWTWKRADNARMLTTGEILAALKRGLLTPALALARLTNLGWTQPDALVEIAQVEQELALAAQHQQSAAAAKIVAARLKAERQEAMALKTAAAAAVKAKKEAIKTAESAARVPLETAIGIGHYDATALLDFAAYNKAVTAGDDIKAQAFLDKAQTAYLEELLSQLKLRQANPGVANAIPTAQPQPNPSPPEGQGASEASTGAAQQPGQPPGQGSGPGSTAGP